MIHRDDLERVASHRPGTHPVASLYLDLAPDANNTRSHLLFLNRKRAEYRERRDHAPHFAPAALDALLDRVEWWLEHRFHRENRGAVIFAEIGGPWFEALQFPVSVRNRMAIDDRPVIAPLAQVLRGYHHHGVILIDREHVRILSVYLGTVLDELESRREPRPAEHVVPDGGYAEHRYQRRRLEEARQFMLHFAGEVERFVSRNQPDDLVILGTAENVARLRAALPPHLLPLVVHTGPTRMDRSAARVVRQIEPLLQRLREEEQRQLAGRLHERVRRGHLATAGIQRTLAAIQAGRVETLLVGSDLPTATGSRCPRCGFLFGPGVGVCAYDGTATVPGIPVVEELVRRAEGSGVGVAFIDPPALDDLRGVGALLRY